MKKILPLFVLIVLSTNSYSQYERNPALSSITIGEIAIRGIIEMRLKYRVMERDTMYFLLYRNKKFQAPEYEGLAFYGGDNTVGALYRVMKSIFLPENISKLKRDYEEVNIYSFKLGADEVSIFLSAENKELVGTVHAPRGYFRYKEKDLDKLFAKDQINTP